MECMNKIENSAFIFNRDRDFTLIDLNENLKKIMFRLKFDISLDNNLKILACIRFLEKEDDKRTFIITDLDENFNIIGLSEGFKQILKYANINLNDFSNLSKLSEELLKDIINYFQVLNKKEKEDEEDVDKEKIQNIDYNLNEKVWNNIKNEKILVKFKILEFLKEKKMLEIEIIFDEKIMFEAFGLDDYISSSEEGYQNEIEIENEYKQKLFEEKNEKVLKEKTTFKQSFVKTQMNYDPFSILEKPEEEEQEEDFTFKDIKEKNISKAKELSKDLSCKN